MPGRMLGWPQSKRVDPGLLESQEFKLVSCVEKMKSHRLGDMTVELENREGASVGGRARSSFCPREEIKPLILQLVSMGDTLMGGRRTRRVIGGSVMVS